jgi:Holliday junction resolvasome RuvABC endonuclease subunit
MTRILGTFIRIRGGSYLCGVAVVESGTIIGSRTLPAPGEPEPRQLAELYERVLAAIDEFRPEVVALRASETQTGERKAKHAEGVVISASGLRNIPVEVKFGRTLASRAGLDRHGTSRNAVSVLVARLGSPTSLPPEVNEAAAAAAAAAVERGEL